MGMHVQCLQSAMAVIPRICGTVVTKCREKFRRTQVGCYNCICNKLSGKTVQNYGTISAVNGKLQYNKQCMDATYDSAVRMFGLAPPLPVRKRSARPVFLTHSVPAGGNHGNTSCTVPRGTWSTQWMDATCKSAVRTFGLAPPLPASVPCRRSGRHRQLRTCAVCPLSELEWLPLPQAEFAPPRVGSPAETSRRVHPAGAAPMH